MILLIIKLLVLEVFIWANAWIDWLKIRDEWKLKHGIEGLSQFAFMTALAFAWNYKFPTAMPEFEFTFKSILCFSKWLISNPGLQLTVFFHCLFWSQFDYVLNFLRHIKWWKLGTNVLDQLLKGYPNRYWRLGLKIVLVIGSFILVVL